ncbi:hypothetical protein DVH24_005976 [Malus domestica]|uniref:Uncharacterized protein n=1 Tax=Malus domestica TaxID=3750 RepID=A0A498IR33_MALDO|nr:hypothetical protein DVH24_005976 [Malus domestica]
MVANSNQSSFMVVICKDIQNLTTSYASARFRKERLLRSVPSALHPGACSTRSWKEKSASFCLVLGYEIVTFSSGWTREPPYQQLKAFVSMVNLQYFSADRKMIKKRWNSCVLYLVLEQLHKFKKTIESSSCSYHFLHCFFHQTHIL